MGLLARRRISTSAKPQPQATGYISEFVTLVIQNLLPLIHKKQIKIITNAGGLDPLACKKAIEEIASKSGINIKVAAITGDDILPRLSNLRSTNAISLFDYTGDGKHPENLPKDWVNAISLNAYLGAIPIAKALDSGATIIVTGRCVDSALVLGPLIHEYKWDPAKDWDLLASGSLAGHIIECGCQATGGNFTDWEESAYSDDGGWENMGYPIIECFRDGEFIVTKSPNTGGIVTCATVGEQMLYEVLDPGAYVLPDVVLDLRNARLEQVGKNRVRVSGAKGHAPTPFLKVSGILVDGFKMTGELLIGGIDASKKAVAVGNAILSHTRSLIKSLGMEDFRAVNVEPLGSEHIYGPHSRAYQTREVVLRITVHHNNLQALRLFGMELAPAATCMAPGITGGGQGRPRPAPNLCHFSFLVKKTSVPTTITTGNTLMVAEFDGPVDAKNGISIPLPLSPIDQIFDKDEKTIRVPLIKLAWGRSGDKGDICNIGILARDPKYYTLLKKFLTAEAVKQYMEHLCYGTVQRYELPGCNGLNFVLTQALGGGGLSSLQIDRQGKTFAQMLLSYPIEVPIVWFSKL